MPQLAKGGKHVFGWSVAGSDGTMKLPPDAVEEYCLPEGLELLIMPGSRTSGGMIVGSVERILESPMGSGLRDSQELSSPEQTGKCISYKGRTVCRALMGRGYLRLPAETLAIFGICPGQRLLAVRGSGLALSLIVQGPIVEEALKHPELEVYQ